MKVTNDHRKRLEFYLHEFYKRFPEEKFTIFHLVRYLKQRQQNKKDAWIGVSGDTGGGKSYFAIMTQILLGKLYYLDKNITYIPKGNEIVEKFERLKRSTLLIDEAAIEMRSVNWQS